MKTNIVIFIMVFFSLGFVWRMGLRQGRAEVSVELQGQTQAYRIRPLDGSDPVFLAPDESGSVHFPAGDWVLLDIWERRESIEE